MASPYSAKLMDHFNDPRNAGAMDDADVVGRSSRNGRAPYTTIYVKICDGKVSRASFQTFGCGVSIACCSALTETINGMRVEECFTVTDQRIREILGGVPSNKAFCAGLAIAAMQDALRKFEDEREQEQKPT